jgi:uncharacterized protein (DUF4415 family)
MNAKFPDIPPSLVDPDDAPELTDEFFDRAVFRIGEREVSAEEGKAAMAKAVRRGRPPLENRKQPLTVRYDSGVIEAFKATGRGWQTRMNDALREWLKTHTAAQGSMTRSGEK